jgi:large subunit ribosomal protein L13
MKTIMANKNTVDHQWYVIDAAEQRLGRLSTEVASLLRGKHKPTYTPHVDGGDYVIIINADKIELTGNKWDQKTYYTHSHYPGGLRSMTARVMNAKFPERLVEKAIKGMLPKGTLGREMFKKCFVYAGDAHPHAAQKPTAYALKG